MQDLEKILVEVKDVIKKAGKTVLFYYGKDYKIKYKAPDSPVTQADIESNKIILSGLKKFNYGILSEETIDDKTRLEKDRVWIIDPIDGTMDFIDKTGEFTIVIGLTEKGKSVLGAVYQPAKDILYYAVMGKGAYMQQGNNRPIRLCVSKEQNLPRTKMLVSRFHISDDVLKLAEKLKIKSKVVCGSAGLKLCLIAAGRAEVNINTSNRTYEWDICAADIILSEAGGRLTDMRGKEFVYNKDNPGNEFGYVASNGMAHEKIIPTPA